eukprot:364208-Chlamydomonas_euryale.AAC.32
MHAIDATARTTQATASGQRSPMCRDAGSCEQAQQHHGGGDRCRRRHRVRLLPEKRASICAGARGVPAGPRGRRTRGDQRAPQPRRRWQLRFY